MKVNFFKFSEQRECGDSPFIEIKTNYLPKKTHCLLKEEKMINIDRIKVPIDLQHMNEICFNDGYYYANCETS